MPWPSTDRSGRRFVRSALTPSSHRYDAIASMGSPVGVRAVHEIIDTQPCIGVGEG